VRFPCHNLHDLALPPDPPPPHTHPWRSTLGPRTLARTALVALLSPTDPTVRTLRHP
jgi:hypothetical protein